MTVKVRKWGNSLGLRIPRTYAEEAHVGAGSEVEITVQAGRLVVTPVRRRSYRLADLLKRVRKDNLHPEIRVGRSRGREAW